MSPELTEDEIELLYREFETRITKRIRRGLFAKEKNRFDELIPRIMKLKFDEAKRQVLMLADTIIAEERGRRERRPEIEYMERPLDALGVFRTRRRRPLVAPPIPVWCRVVEDVPSFESARRRALELKAERPERWWGYAFDPERYTWAVIECERVPPGARVTAEGLIAVGAVERRWRRAPEEVS